MHIALLKDHPEYAPILAYWAFSEWYMTRSIGFDMVIKAYAKRINDIQIPIAWVAIKDGIPAGMVSLKENDLWLRKDLNPWLGSLFVVPEYRKRGIGTALINAVIEKAAELKYPYIYLFIDSKKNDLGYYYDKRGWAFFEDAAGNDSGSVKIYSHKI